MISTRSIFDIIQRPVLEVDAKPVLDRVVLGDAWMVQRIGQPDAAMLGMLSAYPVLRTDINGSIELVTDGEQLWIYTEK